MDITRISRLITALGSAGTQQRNNLSQNERQETKAVPDTNQEAVTVSPEFSQRAAQYSATTDTVNREERLSLLKRSIANGSYATDSTVVAKAVVQELFS